MTKILVEGEKKYWKMKQKKQEIEKGKKLGKPKQTS
jgi:hypothetical protein